ncbi:MAG TPA: hypothetical protein VEL68_09310 [Thermodesulfobacteriota bacterium]|nr:hypothetical protein [Thermodesulfobacteriota bacterium]
MKIGDTKGEQGRFPRFFKVPGNPYTLGHGSFNQGKILEEKQKKEQKKIFKPTRPGQNGLTKR